MTNFKDCCDRIVGANSPIESIKSYNDEIFLGSENGGVFEL